MIPLLIFGGLAGGGGGGAYLELQNSRPFSIENHRFSGAILHSFCISNNKVGICIAIRTYAERSVSMSRRRAAQLSTAAAALDPPATSACSSDRSGKTSASGGARPTWDLGLPRRGGQLPPHLSCSVTNRHFSVEESSFILKNHHLY